jgi:hypothetical protein
MKPRIIVRRETIMSEQPQPAPREGETAPVPDKGGWIDGETGEAVIGGPPPVEGIPVRREDSAEQPAPKRDDPKGPSVPRKAS